MSDVLSLMDMYLYFSGYHQPGNSRYCSNKCKCLKLLERKHSVVDYKNKKQKGNKSSRLGRKYWIQAAFVYEETCDLLLFWQCERIFHLLENCWHLQICTKPAADGAATCWKHTLSLQCQSWALWDLLFQSPWSRQGLLFPQMWGSCSWLCSSLCFQI